MKCEKCASEMPGSMVKCAQCGFNHAANHVDRWKAQRQSTQPETSASEAKPTSPLAAKMRARYATEAKLLQFPVTTKTETGETTGAINSAGSGEPAWREQLKGRVREHLEKRKTDDEVTPADPVLPSAPSEEITSQLIVESALKRIRRTSAPPPATPIPTPRQTLRGGQQALACAYEPEEQLQPEPEIFNRFNEPQVEAALVEPTLAPRPTRPLPNAAPNQVLQLPNRAKSVEQPEAGLSVWVDEENQEIVQPQRSVSVSSAPANVPPARPEPVVQAATETETETAAARKAKLWVGKPAPLWLRAMAGAVDLEAAALAYLPFFGMYTSLDGPPGWSDIYVMASSLAVVIFLYQLITFSFNGRTFGMALCGLRCVDVNDAGAAIPFQRRWRQALGGTVALLCPPANYVVTRLTSYERGLGDALAQTITLRKSQD